MRAITTDEIKALEQYALDMGIPGRILMEMAGMKTANIALHEIKHARRATVICGHGGNGGDGFVTARYLRSSGIDTEVFLASPASKIVSPDTKANYEVLKNIGISITEINSENLDLLKGSLLKTDLVIDAIFGVGVKNGIKGSLAEIINLINKTKTEVKNKHPYFVVSIDIPSGIDLSGGTQNVCVNADITVTFEYPKLGLLNFPAINFAGKIITTGIGIPKPNIIETGLAAATDIVQEKNNIDGINITDNRFIASILHRRRPDINKGDLGRVMIVAGSSGMMGAAVMTSKAAMRTGSGLVNLFVPHDIKNWVNSMSLESTVHDISEIDRYIDKSDVMAIGPGLGSNNNNLQLVKNLLANNKNVPMVIDADGLNAINDLSMFKNKNKEVVITPHPGEFSRLLHVPVETIQKDRIAITKKFAMAHGLTVVLKGAYTVIAGSDGKVYVNPTANPAMASAGTGDVLTGIISSLIGQGLSPFNAAVAGVYIHSMAANLATSIKGEFGLIASDIIDSIPFAIGAII